MKKILLSIILSIIAFVSVIGQNSKVENKGKARVSSVYDMLRMKPGVIVNSGTGEILIRGTGTDSDATQPLVIIDDVKMMGDNEVLGRMMPEEIWSIEVIKDGSSGFYGGMESANGVIIVETKGYHEIKERREAERKAIKNEKRKREKENKKKKDVQTD